MNETIGAILATAAISYVVLYYVIRAAVSAGMLDAERKRAAAEAERQRAIAQRQRGGS